MIAVFILAITTIGTSLALVAVRFFLDRRTRLQIRLSFIPAPSAFQKSEHPSGVVHKVGAHVTNHGDREVTLIKGGIEVLQRSERASRNPLQPFLRWIRLPGWLPQEVPRPLVTWHEPNLYEPWRLQPGMSLSDERTVSTDVLDGVIEPGEMGGFVAVFLDSKDIEYRSDVRVARRLDDGRLVAYG